MTRIFQAQIRTVKGVETVHVVIDNRLTTGLNAAAIEDIRETIKELRDPLPFELVGIQDLGLGLVSLASRPKLRDRFK